MKHLLIACLAAMFVMAAGTASGVVFLYEDFEGDVSEWQKTPDSLWHLETYRSHSPTHSAAYNYMPAGAATPTYNTGSANFGTLYSPVVDITGASALYMSVWSWIQTENWASPGLDWDDYGFDIARLGVYDPVGVPEFGFEMDFNVGPSNQWTYFESPDDLKPMFDSHGVSQFRLGFTFNTVDGLFNDFEGWYLDDLYIHDGDAPPIPEPSTWLLLSTGLLGVGAAARKRFFG